MADSIEHFTRADSFRDSWRGRFHNKWPAMTTMMMKSESEIDYPNITPCPDFGIKSPSLRSWSSSNQDTWTDSRGIDNETTDGETCSQNAKKNKRCERTCNCVLCVFMVLSVIVAVCAGVGLAILLTQPEFGLTGRSWGSRDTLIDIKLEETEMTTLKAKFCNLVKEILRGVNFPTKKGIKSCDAVFKLMKESDGLHVEFHVLPTDGYTLKEKFLRALAELVEARDGNGTMPSDAELNNAEKSANNTNDSTIPKTGGFITFIPEVTIENRSNKSDTNRFAVDNRMVHSNLTDIKSFPDTASAETPKGGPDLTDSGNVLEATNKFDAVGTTKSPESKRKTTKITIARGQVSPKTLAPDLLTSTATESVLLYDSSTTMDTIQVNDIATEAFTKNAKKTISESNSTLANLGSDVIVKTSKSVNTGKMDNTENSTTLKHDTGKTKSVSSKLKVSGVPSASKTRLPEDTGLSERTTIGIKSNSVTKHNTNIVHSIKRVKLFEVGKPADRNNVSTQNENNVPETKTQKDFVAESLMKGGVFKLPMKTTSKFKFLFANGASNKD